MSKPSHPSTGATAPRRAATHGDPVEESAAAAKDSVTVANAASPIVAVPSVPAAAVVGAVTNPVASVKAVVAGVTAAPRAASQAVAAVTTTAVAAAVAAPRGLSSAELSTLLVGQTQAVKKLHEAVQAYLRETPGMRNVLPIFVGGPPGTGKSTTMVKMAEEFGLPAIRIDCAEFKHDPFGVAFYDALHRQLRDAV